MTIKKFTALALALMALNANANDLHKCKDAAGKITYQEIPCQGSTTVSKLKRDTTVGDPSVIARNQAEVAEFQGRRAIRLQAEIDQKIAAEKELETLNQRWNEQQKADALNRLANATEDIARAANAPRVIGVPRGMEGQNFRGHQFGRKR